jgi:hypothetical protein
MQVVTFKGFHGQIAIGIIDRYNAAGAGWLRCEVTVGSPHFHGEIKCFIHAECLAIFYHQLTSSYESLSGNATLYELEETLLLDIVFNDRRVTITGSICDGSFHDNKLSFSFETDQSYIKLAIDDLKSATLEFPA